MGWILAGELKSLEEGRGGSGGVKGLGIQLQSRVTTQQRLAWRISTAALVFAAGTSWS